jgi:hypothetical protein
MAFFFLQFLSMKLATVNPRLDLNIEGLLSKDVSSISLSCFPSQIIYLGI